MEHFDVIIVGAGLSGIGAAYHLQHKCPGVSYVILEGRDDIGGTWDLFRYPGVRSDSDMHTLGYSFKPWKSKKSIASGPAIMEYLRETVAENNIRKRIRFGHLVTKAQWSSEMGAWTLYTSDRANARETTVSCNFLFMCSGYYSYKGGYEPEFAGRSRFAGRIVHPQDWPQDLDYANKRIVVIGSGATAMTLVPALAADACHVTILQRSPTYVVSRPDEDNFANTLRRLFPGKVAYAITRFKNTTMQQLVYKRSREEPAKVRAYLLDLVRQELGPEYDVDKHFTPSYNPWDQRLCLIPNSDLFKAIKSGKASVVTEQIANFTETGIALANGEQVDAEIIITATGLNLVTLGEMDFAVDGKPVDFSRTITYKGFAYSGIPNLASSFGYVNASWTLRADLICEYVCRIVNHMRETSTTMCTPKLRDSDADMAEISWIGEFSPNYMKRVMHKFPHQGDREPWINPQNYKRDKKMFRHGRIDDGVMTFSGHQT